MAALIAEELTDFVARMKSAVLENNGKYTIDCREFALSQVSVLWCLISGDRFRYDNVKLKYFLETVEKFNAVAALDNITIPYPILGTLFPEWSGWNRNAVVFKEMYEFMEVSL